VGEWWHEQAEDYTFFYGEGNGDHQLGTGFFVHERIISAVRKVEFISDTLLYITLKRSLVQYYCFECACLM
jgi:hypothetical protein